MTTAHWSILGSGVTGLCVATTLASHGESIEVIEDSSQISASHFAGGMLAPYCESELAPTVAQQGLESIHWWQKHTPEVVQKGSLVLASGRDYTELKRFASRTTRHQWVRPQDLEMDISHLQHGLFFPDEAHLDPRRALHHLRQQLINRGVPFHQGKAQGKMVDCRGYAAQPLLRDLRAVRGEMLRIRQPELNITRPIRLLHPRFPCYLVPRKNGEYMLGATMIESHDTGSIHVRSMMELLSALYTIHPAFAEAEIIETGVGLRPAYPSNLPKIDYQHGRFLINGMHRHGFLCAPLLAEQFIQQLQGKTPHAAFY